MESLNTDIRIAIATNPNCRKFLDAGKCKGALGGIPEHTRL